MPRIPDGGHDAGPDGGPAIELRGLSREFNDRVVLSGVSLTLEPGETLSVQGPNGSGKTTLLRVLAGLLRPSGGEARVLGCEIPGERWRLRGRVGWLGHEPLLYRDLSARENLEFAARLNGLEPDAAGARIDTLLDDVGLGRRGADPVRDYSAGMLQRAAVCRAVLHQPGLLLLDEPFSHLDDEGRERVEPLLSAGTRVLVSHDAAEAAGADRVLRLSPKGTPIEAVAA